MPGPIDMHVHIVGNGAGGSGCWMRLKSWRKLMARFIVRHVGLPPAALSGDFDPLYVERLLHLVRSSSLQSIVILAQDQIYNPDGTPRRDPGAFYVPNDYVLKLSRDHSEFLPAVSIHPARRDALDELEKCRAEGAVLLKLLPNYHGVDCRDRRYQQFWERMAEAGLPLLAHTGSEFTVPVIRPDLADPRILELPLECGVTVIAAHCATRNRPFERDYFPAFVEMTRKHPRLYGDVSAFNTPVRGEHTRRCVRTGLVERMVHGSDFPVPVSGLWAWLRGFVTWKTYRRWEREANVLERDYQLKRAMGFPEECFTRARQLLAKKNRAK